MKRPFRLGEGMRDEQGWHATDCQPIVSRRPIRVRQIHKRVKTLRILVGATGFEPATPCGPRLETARFLAFFCTFRFVCNSLQVLVGFDVQAWCGWLRVAALKRRRGVTPVLPPRGRLRHEHGSRSWRCKS
jgi:hypothetical protein